MCRAEGPERVAKPLNLTSAGNRAERGTEFKEMPSHDLIGGILRCLVTEAGTWLEPMFLLLRRAMPRCAPPC